MMVTIERPKCVLDRHLEYLDTLRSTGITNMFGARPYLMNAFKTLAKNEAASILSYWMKTFGNPTR